MLDSNLSGRSFRRKSFKKELLIVALITCFITAQAQADECKGIVTQDIPDNSYDGKAGTVIEQLHEYEGKPDGPPLTYAVHGGGVYPADHIRILNCTIHKISTDPYYELKLNNTSENADDIIMQKAEAQLLQMGMDNADASNAAYAYAKSPDTACGKMAARAINGDQSAASLILSGGICP